MNKIDELLAKLTKKKKREDISPISVLKEVISLQIL